MRVLFQLLVGSLALFACNGPVMQGTAGTDSGSGSSTGDSSTTDDPTGSGGGVCTPGASLACTCPSGDKGAQICNADGKSLGPCVCEGGSGSDSDATTTTTTGTTDPDTTTTTGVDTTTTTTTGDTTGPDTTTGSLCDDPGPEPNDIEAQAVDLGDMQCNDDAETFAGVLAEDTDIDWFVYHGIYQNCGILAGDPDATQELTADATLRMCAFAECDMGPVAIECHDGATMSLSPDGRPGCCKQGDVRFTVDCIDGSNESARIFIRLDQGLAGACVAYSVDYSYPT